MKHQTATRLSALLLAGILMLSALACGKTQQDDPTGETTTAADTSVSADVTTTPPADTSATETTVATTKYIDDLPEDLTYEGKTVTFLYREEIQQEFWSDAMTGDVAGDAIYESILEVEERFGIDIQTVFRKGHIVNVRNEYMEHIDNQILAGDSTYDWVDLMIGNAPNRMSSGNFVNLLNLESIDFSKPWYIPNMVETVSILDRLYFVSGDSSLGYLKCAFCIYYNKDLGDRYGIEDLNAVVKSGKWTVEKVMQIASQACTDLNSDGKYNLDDQLGYVNHDNNHPRGFIASTGMQLFVKNTDGSHELVFGSDRDHSVCTALSKLQNETVGAYYTNVSNASATTGALYNEISSLFCSDRIFMISAEMGDVVDCGYHAMESTYGVLPFPKYDEAQESYYTSSRNTHNAFLMPVTCEDPEMAAAIMEALSAVKYQKVLPAFYEVVLKTKYSADSETAEIFDIIHDTMVLDFGYTYDNALNNPVAIYTNILKNVNNFASEIKAKSRVIEKVYDTYVEKIKTKCAE